jgi:hypothetical protein
MVIRASLIRVIMDATTGAEADVPKTRENPPSIPEKLTINSVFSGLSFDERTDNVVSPLQPYRGQSFDETGDRKAYPFAAISGKPRA